MTRYIATAEGHIPFTPEEEAAADLKEAEWLAGELDRNRAVKLEAIKAKRIAKAEGGMIFAGKLVPTDKEAIVLVESAIKYLDGKVGKTVKRAGLGTIDKQTLDAYFEAMAVLHEGAFVRESDLFDLITAAQTVEQLDAIDIEGGW